MSTDAGSTRVSIGPRMRTLVALLVAVATFAIGAAPAVAVASGADTTHGEEVRTEIGQPASVVVNRVGRSMRDTMDGTAFTVAVIAARKRAADAALYARIMDYLSAIATARAVQAERDAVWDRIAACETGGNWAMTGSSYSGGVGFANSTWNAFGGQEFASNAGYASREQQIVVAERVRAYGGYSGWGCAYTIGLISR
jgi:hypothetical protein